MATTVKNKYNCTQAALYSGCDTLADNLDEHEADFVLLKGKYAAGAVSAALRAAKTAALNLPDAQARGELSEAMRTQLTPLNEKCLLNWQNLKRYINDTASFPKAEWKAREEAAGGNYYGRADNKNWENTVNMNVSAVNFMTTNSVTLEAGGANMPAGFPAQYALDATAFVTLYNSFKVAIETKDATEDKVEANNAAYALAIDICKDGQIIYKNDEGKSKLFTWTALMEIIDPKLSGLKVKVLNGYTNVFEAGVNVSLQKIGDPPIVLPTAANGVANFSPLAEGNYILICTKAGFVTVGPQDVSVKKGTTGTLDIMLLPVNVKTGTVNGGQVVNISTTGLTVDGDTVLKLKMTDGDTVRFYFAATTNAQPGGTFADVNAAEEVTVTAGALGYSGTNVFLNVKNIQAPAANYRVVVG